jgi:hypothetical protein
MLYPACWPGESLGEPGGDRNPRPLGLGRLSFAGSSVAVAYRGERPARIANFLFRYAPTGDSIAPHVTIYLVPGGEPDQLAVYREGSSSTIYRGDSETVAAELLMSETCRELAERSQGGLLFHAAALTWRGKGLLMPGMIRAGKTTLTAWLVTRGFDYLTDEYGDFDQVGECVEAVMQSLAQACG